MQNKEDKFPLFFATHFDTKFIKVLNKNEFIEIEIKENQTSIKRIFDTDYVHQIILVKSKTTLKEIDIYSYENAYSKAVIKLIDDGNYDKIKK